VSKIYDALRKAERDKRGKPKESRAKPAKSAKARPGITLTDRQRDGKFLSGMDENFRRSLLTLRNAVESEKKEQGTGTIVFSSAVSGEGTTTVIASFARVLAIGGSQRICVVDCSVRNPMLHRVFGVENKKGVIDFLGGEAAIETIIHDVDGIDFIPAGVSENIDIAIPLFNSEKMSRFMRHLAEIYDYVLIDAPAILEAPETPIISSYSDGVILVIQTGSTRREVIKRAMLMVEKLDGRFIGTVLNKKKYYIPGFIYRRV
jgi:protein-tyrosine kinase